MVEVFLWPGFRAGIIFGDSLFGSLAFYGIEAGLGAAIYFRLSYAGLIACAENIIYLLLTLKFILITPLDIALCIGEDMTEAVALSRSYKASLPGIIYSAFHVIFRIKISTLDIRNLISK